MALQVEYNRYGKLIGYDDNHYVEIQARKMDAYQIELKCDECVHTTMQLQHILPGDEAEYVYRCTKCLKTVTLSVQYPTIVYLPAGEDE